MPSATAAIEAIAEYQEQAPCAGAGWAPRLRQGKELRRGNGFSDLFEGAVLSAAALVPALLEETLWMPLGKAAQKILNVFNRV